MKILLTGGGSGGHFYPIIAIAQQLNEIAKESKLLKPEIYFMSTSSYNEGLLYENGMEFIQVGSGKIRNKLSLGNLILNFFDLWKIFFGTISATWEMYWLFPDVVFGKGGYVSFPALFAARILGIPVVIHESDSIPGRVNLWAKKFAKRIAISYPEAGKFFPKDKTAYTGNPIRKEIIEPLVEGAHELLGLDPSVPTVLILGGSQGAKFINETVMDALPELVKNYQVIHQTGKNNFAVIKQTAEVVLLNNQNKNRYKVFDYLNDLNMRAGVGVSQLIVSRAGSTIFEIAVWGKPSIIIPIPEPTSHDQRSNAYAYARTGAAEVIEEKNLTAHVLIGEIERIISSQEEKEKMSQAAKSFARVDAARLIADEIMSIGLEHES